jgi:hypothetical protein
MKQALRSIVVAVGTVALLLSLAQRADAIGPSLLMFYGGNLKAPVYVAGADANLFNNLLSPSTVAAQDLSGRTYLKVAVFWGTQANPTGHGVALADLKPEMAWQHGKYFPATGSKPAVLVVTQLDKKKEARIPDYSADASFPWGGTVPPAAASAAQAALTGSKPGR